MRVTEEAKLTTTLTVDIVCNKCGKSCKRSCDYEHASIVADWGYDSPKDSVQQTADLCEPCWDAFAATFAIPPEQT